MEYLKNDLHQCLDIKKFEINCSQNNDILFQAGLLVVN